MTLRDDDTIPIHIRDAIIRRFEGWELVEFLNIDIEDILEALEEQIVKNLESLEEELDLVTEEEEDD